jgi:general stress protein CsbA
MMLYFSRFVVILKSRILVSCSIGLTMTLTWLMCQRAQNVAQSEDPIGIDCVGMLLWMIARKVFKLYIHLMMMGMMEVRNV